MKPSRFYPRMPATSRPLRICKGDLDGFLGLFIDNLLQLLLIFTLRPCCAASGPPT